MENSGTEIRWDPGPSRWKRNQRKYVRPIITSAIKIADDGLNALGIEEKTTHVMLSRGINNSIFYGFVGVDGSTELFIKASDIKHRKIARQHDFWALIAFHEGIHINMNKYVYPCSALGAAVHEGSAYCLTHLFKTRKGLIDDSVNPFEVVSDLSAVVCKNLKKEVLETHGQIGEVPVDDWKKGNRAFDITREQAHRTPFSKTELFGILAVAKRFNEGIYERDLPNMPMHEVLGFETAA